ncbi:MAG: molybdopterin-binding protein [Candidatus Manganitrophaceae bacterium]|nr:MAG: molybdopterin-binding protein [Candidatus Manganitrophaceae bacterium]
MKKKISLDRRRFLVRAAQLSGLFLLAGCENLSRKPWFEGLLSSAEGVTRRVQRLITPRKAMAREFTEADLSPVFPVNGTSDPDTEEYLALAQNNFSGWQLEVGGLVETPARFSLAELRQLPSRTQITRHDCVEGWSAIGKWKGVPLNIILDRVRPRPQARYVVFHSADPDELGQYYYESIDFEDAYHPQTILAYDLNDRPLPIGNGAPLRLRLERQLGYKMAKYVMRIELVDRLDNIAGGKGGYWEDQGYEWYAGI